jgi:hypothetical protein
VVSIFPIGWQVCLRLLVAGGQAASCVKHVQTEQRRSRNRFFAAGETLSKGYAICRTGFGAAGRELHHSFSI